MSDEILNFLEVLNFNDISNSDKLGILRNLNTVSSDFLASQKGEIKTLSVVF
jgi:hypothetical protein